MICALEIIFRPLRKEYTSNLHYNLLRLQSEIDLVMAKIDTGLYRVHAISTDDGEKEDVNTDTGTQGNRGRIRNPFHTHKECQGKDILKVFKM